ncbi:MAG: hypothetical protein MUP55_03260 [Candidatus Aenigmarchaeota archaeon]|nr:hypothetical protein [Candidatus Aenigmarchaeota archaeon]
MANGEWKNVENVVVGDRVLSPQYDGSVKFVKVEEIYKWQSKKNYKIQMINQPHNSLYECSSNHIIPVEYQFFPTVNGKRAYSTSIWEHRNYECEKLAHLKDSYLINRCVGLGCPLIPFFDTEEKCQIEPYTLGIYLSDGNFKATSPNITTGDDVTIAEIQKHYQYMRVNAPTNKKCKTYFFSMKSELALQLIKYGLRGKTAAIKFIPQSALLASSEYRKRLLAGFIDGDCGYHKQSYTYSTKSSQMADDFVFLVHSLGGRARKKKIFRKQWGVYYLVRFYIQTPLPIQREKRKQRPENYLLNSSTRIPIKAVPTNSSEVFGFFLASESGLYITDNWMLTHNSGKSMSVISLAKQIYPTKFSYKNICFFDSKVLELAPAIPRDSIIIRDENPSKSVYGAGSQRIEMDIVVLSETVRKYGLSLIFVEPSERQMDIVKWYLETVDIDYDNRITRLAIKDPHTKTFLGAVYVPVLQASDPDWIEYNKIKDAFIDDVRKGNYSGAKADYTSLARKVASKIDTNIFRKKQDRLVYVQSMFPTFTNQEVRIIHTFVEIIIKGGDSALPTPNNTE